MTKGKQKPLLIAGGGTGGHVLSGLALIEEWNKKGEMRSLFIGAKGGLEEKLVPRAGVRLELLKIGALNRVGLSRKLRTLFLLPYSLFQSIWIFLRERPWAVVGVGGYASGPFVFVSVLLGKLLGTRTAILEQNTVPGLTNRLLGRIVGRVFAAFPGTEKAFPGKNVVIVGNPIRNSFDRLPPACTDPFQLFVFGGSQGAMGLNTLLIEAIPFLAERKDQMRILHQTGEKDFDRVTSAYAGSGLNTRIEKFIFDMKGAYAESSLITCRAGSSSLFEIARVGRASILVPLPTAADDHQSANAKTMESLGGAIVFPQMTGKGREFADLIFALMENPERIRKMEMNAHFLDRSDSASRILELLREEN